MIDDTGARDVNDSSVGEEYQSHHEDGRLPNDLRQLSASSTNFLLHLYIVTRPRGRQGPCHDKCVYRTISLRDLMYVKREAVRHQERGKFDSGKAARMYLRPWFGCQGVLMIGVPSVSPERGAGLCRSWFHRYYPPRAMRYKPCAFLGNVKIQDLTPSQGPHRRFHPRA